MGRPQFSYGKRNYRQEPREQRHQTVLLTPDGVPAATLDAPKTSPVVFVSDESRSRFPWLPPRVIAGSVWRGPLQERVTVDRNGTATHWRCGPVSTAA